MHPDRPTDYDKLYRAVPIFHSLTTDEMDEMMLISYLMRAPKGCVILEEGKKSSGLYVVVTGMVTCRMKLYQGDETHLANLHKGDVVGEVSLIDQGACTATVTAVEDSILYYIDSAQFNEMRQAMRPAAFKVMRALAPTVCDRLRSINARIADVFDDPERHLEIMTRRYHKLAQTAMPVDAPSE